MKHTIAIGLILILLSGCATQKRCNDKFPPSLVSSESKSLSTSVTSVDSLRASVTPQDSSMIKLLIECNERGEAYLKQIEAYSYGARVSPPSVKIAGNVLTASCKADSITIYNIIKKRFKSETEYRDRRVEVTKYTNMLTPAQRWMIAGFWVVSCVLVLIAVLYVKRLFKHS